VKAFQIIKLKEFALFILRFYKNAITRSRVVYTIILQFIYNKVGTMRINIDIPNLIIINDWFIFFSDSSYKKNYTAIFCLTTSFTFHIFLDVSMISQSYALQSLSNILYLCCIIILYRSPGPFNSRIFSYLATRFIKANQILQYCSNKFTNKT
jgi:hypothetical protein